MKRFNKFSKKISSKLALMFFLVSIIPIVLTGFISFYNSRTIIKENVKNQLSAVGDDKIQEVNALLDIYIEDVQILANSKNTLDGYNILKTYHDNGGVLQNGSYNTNTDDYRALYEQIDPYFKNSLSLVDVHDIMIICTDHGHIMYSAKKSSYLGSHLDADHFDMKDLKMVWSKVKTTLKPNMTDYAVYGSHDEHVMYMGAPVFNENNQLVAVLAVVISSDKIDKIMAENSKLGKTGIGFLAGDDYLMRSNLPGSGEENILITEARTEGVELGLQDKNDVIITENFSDEKVISYFKHVGLNENFNTDFDWVMVVEIDKAEAFMPVNRHLIIVLIIAVLIISLVAIISNRLSKQFTKPILCLKKVLKKMEEGDLNQEIAYDRRDEFGDLADSFRNMQSNLNKQIKDISIGASTLSETTSEIMSMVSQLASGSAETASAVSETTATIAEIRQTVEVSTRKAADIATSGDEIVKISQEGDISVQRTIEGMMKIKQEMQTIANIVIQLSKKSNTIGEIASSVDDLAEQSNLLAVNASIEAAKAGEHGKGFSVVAREIKNLANRSKDATVQIRTILADIQKDISNAVMATEQGGKVIDVGADLSNKASEVISTLAKSIEQATQETLIIAASNQEQLTGIDQISTAMESIKDASNQNSSSTKHTEQSIKELNKLGGTLLDMLKAYNFEKNGY